MSADLRAIRLSESERALAVERAERTRSAFVGGYRRRKPRDAETARLLRERGTPERLIGPTR